jgi:post-segregation antitoxin (ccd killing protein)
MHGHLAAHARARGMTVSQLVNELLGKALESLRAAGTRAQP